MSYAQETFHQTRAYIKQYETNNYVRETITIYVTRRWFLAARLLKQSVPYLVCHVYGCMWTKIRGPLPPSQKWHIHWEFLDFKSGFGFTTKIYPRSIFIFKWMPSNNSDTNLFLILQNYLRPFQQWMPLLLQTTQPIRMQGQQKILPPAGEEGHSSNENA